MDWVCRDSAFSHRFVDLSVAISNIVTAIYAHIYIYIYTYTHSEFVLCGILHLPKKKNPKNSQMKRQNKKILKVVSRSCQHTSTAPLSLPPHFLHATCRRCQNSQCRRPRVCLLHKACAPRDFPNAFAENCAGLG